MNSIAICLLIWSSVPVIPAGDVPPIVVAEDVQPGSIVFDAPVRERPLVLRSADQAAKIFPEDELAKLTRQVDFERQVVLVFAWTGSGQDRFDFHLTDSLQQQVFFLHTMGQTDDLRHHTRTYIVRNDVQWLSKKVVQ